MLNTLGLFLVLLQKVKLMMPLSALIQSAHLVPCCPRGARAGDSHTPGLLRLRLKLIPLVFSGFKAATFSLILCSSGETVGCHSSGKNLNFIFSLEGPFWTNILRLVVGSMEVVGFSLFCVKERGALWEILH